MVQFKTGTTYRLRVGANKLAVVVVEIFIRLSYKK